MNTCMSGTPSLDTGIALGKIQNRSAYIDPEVELGESLFWLTICLGGAVLFCVIILFGVPCFESSRTFDFLKDSHIQAPICVLIVLRSHASLQTSLCVP